MSIKRFFRRSDWDDERARELEAHLAIETDENIARGMSPGDARDAARRKLGNTTRIREQIYEANTVQPLETIRLDCRDAWRQLRRRPLITALAVVLLTIGIGASTAAFTIAYGVLLRPLAYPDADRLATLWQRTDDRREQVSYPDFADLRGAAAFEASAALASGRATLMIGGADRFERINVVEAEPGFFALVGARAVAGRLLAAGDAGRPAALISHRLWRGAFGGSPDAIGRTVDVSGQLYTVAGVVAAGLDFELPVGGAALGTAFTIKDVDLWTVLDAASGVARNRAVSTYEALIKLRRGVSVDEAQRALTAAGAALAREHPETNRSRSFEIVPLREQIVSARAPAVLLAFAGSALMLLIACVNLVSLSLGDLPSRRRDFALREALGAARGRLLRQVAIESVIVAGAGGTAGVVAAAWLVRALTAAIDLPRVEAIRFDAPVILFAILAACGAGLLARLAPMFGLESAPNGLRSSIATASAPRLRRVLVAGQIAGALALSATAALLGASFRELLVVDPGFDTARVMSARVSAYPSRYPEREAAVRFFNRLVDGLAAHHDVEAAAAGSALPLTGSSVGTSVAVEGALVPMAQRPAAGWQTVTPGYFAALAIPFRAGRDFSRADLDRRQHVIVINRSLARVLFGDANPIGRRLTLGPDRPDADWHEIIGVVGDVRHTNLASPAAPRAYDLFGQHWSRTLFIVARARGDANVLAPVLRREVARLDPQAPIFEMRSLAGIVDDSVASRRLGSAFAGGLAVLGLLVSAIGVYGLLASTVAARTREFGIRRALGSSPARLATLIVGEGAALAAVGIAAGVTMALAIGRAIESQLFGVRSDDPRVLGAVAIVLAVVALAASLLPARRASRVDPAITLRDE